MLNMTHIISLILAVTIVHQVRAEEAASSLDQEFIETQEMLETAKHLTQDQKNTLFLRAADFQKASEENETAASVADEKLDQPEQCEGGTTRRACLQVSLGVDQAKVDLLDTNSDTAKELNSEIVSMTNELSRPEAHRKTAAVFREEVRRIQLAEANQNNKLTFKQYAVDAFKIAVDSWKYLITPGPLVALASGTAGYFALRSETNGVTNYYKKHQWTGAAYEVGNYIGQGILLIPLTAAALLIDNDKLREAVTVLIPATLDTLIQTTIEKYTLKALLPAQETARPNGGTLGDNSGHAATAFVMATVLAGEFGLKAAVPAFVVAIYVAWSRVGGLMHSPKQVFAGAALGISEGIAALIAKKKILGVDFSAGPTLENGGVGLRVHGSFR